MTLVITANVVGQPRGEPVRLSNRRRRLSTVVARHRPAPGRRFVVSVHRRGELGEIYRPSDRTVRLRATWAKTLVGPNDVVLITAVPLGSGAGSIGLAIASIALIVLAPYAAPAIAGAALFGAGAGVATGSLTLAIQAGLVIGGVALGYAAQASKASGNKNGPQSYGITGGGNVPKPGSRKPLLYGRRWSSPPLSQQDYVNIDGDATVLVKRMTLGIGKFQPHRIRVGDALFWDEATGIQAPFSSATGPLGAAIEFLYEQPSTIAPGDIIPSPAVGGQELPRPGGNPARTPWYRVAPQGISVDASQVNWTYPAIYRVSSSQQRKPAPAGAVWFAREIDPNTGAVLGPEFEAWRTAEPGEVYITTPLRRVAYFRWPKRGAYEICAQNAYPAPLPDVEIENRVVWDALFAFEDDTRIRPQTTEIVLRMRAGKGLTVTAYSDITVEATRIVPVWDGAAWIEQATNKAVWAYCDLVRAVYGLDLPDGVDADKARYYADLLATNDTYDGQLPEAPSFWEAASEVLLPLRADPVKVGAVHSFVRDESRAEPRHVISRRQIVRDSAGATFKTRVEGSDVIVEFDRDGDPKRPDEARFSYGPPTRTPKRYKVAGISDGLHALKHATWLAAVAVFRGAERKVTTEWDGRLVYPGDHILSDLWFLKGKQTYGVAARDGNVLTLDVTANVGTAYGYGSIRTRVGREWGILRMRGVGARGLELHPDDVAALQARTGLALGDVLARDTQDPTTVVLGDLVELQETYVARSAIPSDGDHVQIEMVADDARVWQLLDEQVIAPAPVNADGLAEPLVPQISVLHAKCDRIETGIEVVWGVSATRGARNYEVEISYDSGRTWDVLSPFGPASSGRAQMRQVDGPVTVRARAYGRTGLPGDWVETTFTTVAPIVDGAQVQFRNLPLVDRAGLTAALQAQLFGDAGLAGDIAKATADLAVAQAAVQKAQQDVVAAQAAADKAEADAFDAITLAQDAKSTAAVEIDKDRGQISQLAASSTTYLIDQDLTFEGLANLIRQVTQDKSDTRRDFAYARQNLRAGIDENGRAIATYGLELGSFKGQTSARFLQVAQTIADGDSALSTFIQALTAQVNDPNTGLSKTRADVIVEQSARADGDAAQALARETLAATVATQYGQTQALIVSERSARSAADEAEASARQTLAATVDAAIGQTQALIDDERLVRTAADEAEASARRTLAATVDTATGQTRALIIDEASARATAVQAETSARTAQVSQLSDTLYAAIANEASTRQTADASEATARQAVGARVDAAQAAISSTQQAIVTGDAANATAIQQVGAQLGSRFAGGRITFSANAAPSGVSARYAIELVSQDGNSAQGSGLYIDLNADGSSAITLDARRVRFGNAGTGVYPFSYDDATQTLTVANLKITKSLILPGYANIPVRFDIANYTMASGQGTANSVVDPNIIGTINVENDSYPTFIGISGEIEVGSSGSMIAMQLVIDGVFAANIIVGSASSSLQSQGAVVKGPISSQTVRFLSVGSHQAKILFSYVGANAGSYLKINSLQFAGFTPRA